jgi:hypothetical protein
MRSGSPDGSALSGAPQNSSDQNAAGPAVQLAQYAPAMPRLPMPGGVFRPGTPENDAFTRNFIDSNRRAGREIGDAIGSIFHNDIVISSPTLRK